MELFWALLSPLELFCLPERGAKNAYGYEADSLGEGPAHIWQVGLMPGIPEGYKWFQTGIDSLDLALHT